MADVSMTWLVWPVPPPHFFGLWVSGHIPIATASVFCQGGFPFRIP